MPMGDTRRKKEKKGRQWKKNSQSKKKPTNIEIRRTHWDREKKKQQIIKSSVCQTYFIQTFETSFMTLLAWEKLKLDLTFNVANSIANLSAVWCTNTLIDKTCTHSKLVKCERIECECISCLKMTKVWLFETNDRRKKCRHSRMHWHMQIIICAVCTQSNLLSELDFCGTPNA